MLPLIGSPIFDVWEGSPSVEFNGKKFKLVKEKGVVRLVLANMDDSYGADRVICGINRSGELEVYAGLDPNLGLLLDSERRIVVE